MKVATEILDNSRYGQKIDLFSIRVLLFLVQNVTASKILIRQKLYYWKSFNKFTNGWIDLCINVDPQGRPSLGDICDILIAR